MIKKEELKVYDLYKDGKGIFHYINEIEELPFGDNVNVQNIDLTFMTLYGNRNLSTPISRVIGDDITSEKLQQVASMIYGMYFDKWSNLFDVYSERVDLDSYVSVTTEKVLEDGTSSLEVTQEGNTTHTSNVSGYNTEDWSNKDMDTQSNTDNTMNAGVNTNKQERERETRGSLGNRLDDRRKAYDILRGEVINDIVYRDVIQLVGTLMF